MNFPGKSSSRREEILSKRTRKLNCESADPIKMQYSSPRGRRAKLRLSLRRWKIRGKIHKKDTTSLECVLVWWWHPCFATLCWCYDDRDVRFMGWPFARSPSISLVENRLLRGKSPGSKTRTKTDRERGGVKSDFHNGCLPLTRPDDGIETADWIGGTLIGGDSLTRKIGEWFFQKRIRGFVSLFVFSSFRSGISFEFEQFARHNRLFYV